MWTKSHHLLNLWFVYCWRLRMRRSLVKLLGLVKAVTKVVAGCLLTCVRLKLLWDSRIQFCYRNYNFAQLGRVIHLTKSRWPIFVQILTGFRSYLFGQVNQPPIGAIINCKPNLLELKISLKIRYKLKPQEKVFQNLWVAKN